MRSLCAVLAVALTFVVIAQTETTVGNWSVSADKDVFTAKESIILSIGENGQPVSASRPVLLIDCAPGFVRSVGVRFPSYIRDADKVSFQYVNSRQPNTVRDGTGLLLSNVLLIGDTTAAFANFKLEALHDATTLTFKVTSESGLEGQAGFDLSGLNDALKEAGCRV